MAVRDLPKVKERVRFPYPAPQNRKEVILDILTKLLPLFLLGGFTVWLLQKLVAPAFELKDVLSDIAHDLSYNGNVYGNPGTWPQEKMDTVADGARKFASVIRKLRTQITLYELYEFIHFLPKNEDLIEAERSLIRLSNSIHDQSSVHTNWKDVEFVKKVIGAKF